MDDAHARVPAYSGKDALVFHHPVQREQNVVAVADVFCVTNASRIGILQKVGYEIVPSALQLGLKRNTDSHLYTFTL